MEQLIIIFQNFLNLCLTKKEKSDVVKKAQAGKDIGKKGKGFEKVAQAAGGGEKGQKIAAAAMWKNIKR